MAGYHFYSACLTSLQTGGGPGPEAQSILVVGLLLPISTYPLGLCRWVFTLVDNPERLFAISATALDVCEIALALVLPSYPRILSFWDVVLAPASERGSRRVAILWKDSFGPFYLLEPLIIYIKNIFIRHVFLM